jgi:flagellar biosynthesis protein FliR
MLVLFRIAGIMTLAPLLSASLIPVRVKFFIVLLLSMAVFPLVPQTAWIPTQWAGLVLAVGTEMLIGITMGFALSLLFSGLEIGIEMVSHQMGLSMAQLIDPLSDITTNVLSQFYTLLATLIYILMNGHLVLIKSLVQTFQTVPLMGARVGESVVDTLVSILTGSYMLAIRVAGPALVAIFLATIALGFISRTMPQLNILAAGFSIRIFLAFIMLIASLAAVFLVFEEDLIVVLHKIGLIFS